MSTPKSIRGGGTMGSPVVVGRRVTTTSTPTLGRGMPSTTVPQSPTHKPTHQSAGVTTRNAYLNIVGGSQIDVYVRLRPMTASESELEPPGTPSRVLALEDGRRVSLYERREVETFEFNRVFPSLSSQEEVHVAVMSEQVEHAVKGQSSCVFAYGQTGSGKTFTAFGDLSTPRLYGLIPRTAEALFAGLEGKWGSGARELAVRLGLPPGSSRPYVRMSIVEVYNEELSDLLFPTGVGGGGGGTPSPKGVDAGETRVVPFATAMDIIRRDQAEAARVAAHHAKEREREGRKAGATSTHSGNRLTSPDAGAAGGGLLSPTSAAAAAAAAAAAFPTLQPTPLSIVDHPTRGTLVLSLTQVEISSAGEAVELLKVCEARSHWAETAMNKVSNRAHRIITFSTGLVHTKRGSGGGGGEGTWEEEEALSDLRIVDLAGSEDTNRSLVTGVSKAEASFINKSLLVLGRVIMALASGSPHIPYRESKLTRLLSEALGGVCKTTFVCCVSPAAANLGESASTLRYAKRAGQALNIASLPKGQQDELLIAALMRRLEGAEADTAERVRVVNELAEGLAGELEAVRAENASLAKATHRATTHFAALRAQNTACSGALSLTALRAERLEAACSELGVALRAALWAKEGLAVDRAALCGVLEGVRATRDALLTAAAATESSLGDDARALLGSLGAALSEAAALHSEIARKRALSRANEVSLEGFSGEVSGVLGGALEDCAALGGEVGGRVGEAVEGLAGVAGERAAHASALAGDVRRLVRSLQEVVVGLGESVAGAEGEARARSLKVREDVRANGEGLAAALGALKSSVEAGVAGVRSVAGQIEDTLNSWAGRSARALDALQAAEEAWVSRVASEGVTLSNILAGAAAAHASAAEAHGAAIEQYRAEDAGEAVAAGERLVSEIHSHLARAVAELTSASGARWSKAGALLRAQSATSSHDVILALKRGAAGTTALASAAEAHGRVSGLDVGELKRLTGGSAAAAGGLLGSLKGSVEGMGGEVGERCAKAGARVVSGGESVNEALVQGDVAVATHAASVATRVGGACTSATAASDAIATSISAATAASSSTLSSLRTHLTDLSLSTTSGLDSLRTSLNHALQAHTTFTSSTYRRDTHSDPTPATYTFPKVFAAMPQPLALALKGGTSPRPGEKEEEFLGRLKSLEGAWEREEALRSGVKQPGMGVDFPGKDCEPKVTLVLPHSGGSSSGGGGGGGGGSGSGGTTPAPSTSRPPLDPVEVAGAVLRGGGSGGGGGGGGSTTSLPIDLTTLDNETLKAVVAAALVEVGARAKAVDAESKEVLKELAAFASTPPPAPPS